MIYLAFGIEGIGKAQPRYDLVRRSVEWLTGVSAVARPPREETVIGMPHPNPTAGVMAVPLHLDEQAHCTVWLYNMRGEMIATLVDDRIDAGDRMMRFDISQIPSGAYALRAEVGGRSWVRMVTVMR